MTAQMMDGIQINGIKHDLACEPLDPYIEQWKKSHKIIKKFTCTACWRGYIAEWEILDDKLYLTNISGIKQFKMEPYVTISTLFPDSKENIFAKWFTGTLWVPMGNQLQYIHSGYASVYERDLVITINKGWVVSQNTIENELPKELYL